MSRQRAKENVLGWMELDMPGAWMDGDSVLAGRGLTASVHGFQIDHDAKLAPYGFKDVVVSARSQDGRCVSHLWWYLTRQRRYTNVDETEWDFTPGMIHDMIADPDHRGQGIFGRLVQAALDLRIEREWPPLWCNDRSLTDPGLRAARRYGFAHHERPNRQRHQYEECGDARRDGHFLHP